MAEGDLGTCEREWGQAPESPRLAPISHHANDRVKSRCIEQIVERLEERAVSSSLSDMMSSDDVEGSVPFASGTIVSVDGRCLNASGLGREAELSAPVLEERAREGVEFNEREPHSTGAHLERGATHRRPARLRPKKFRRQVLEVKHREQPQASPGPP